MRRIEAVTGVAADALVRERFDALERAAAAVGAQSLEALADRIAALQDELRETKRRLKAGAGAGIPKPGELAAGAAEVAPGVRLVAARRRRSTRWTRSRRPPATSASILGSGVVALALDADEPQLFVTVSDDLVARGISAGDLVTAAMPALEGRGGGRPGMAQGTRHASATACPTRSARSGPASRANGA